MMMRKSRFTVFAFSSLSKNLPILKITFVFTNSIFLFLPGVISKTLDVILKLKMAEIF